MVNDAGIALTVTAIVRLFQTTGPCIVIVAA